jgi:nucleotide-binding universal stress UspA family protein
MDSHPEARHVLAALEGTPGDDVAIAWAVREALMRGLPLQLMHVVAPPASLVRTEDDTEDETPPDRTASRVAAGHSMLTAVADRLRSENPSLRVDHEVQTAPVVPTLLRAAHRASLVVLGSGRRFDPGHARLGSVAVHVTEHARCPIVVARRPEEGEPRGGPGAGRVVVGVDGSAASAEAVRFAFEEASWRGLGLTAVHAWEHTFGNRDAHDLGPTEDEPHARRVLAESLAGWAEKYPDVAIVRQLVADHPVRALLEQSAGAELLVTGSHGSRYFPGMLLGSVSQALLRHSGTTVAVVRPAHVP